MLFQDKVVFITGGGRGIGKEAARLFAKEGAKLVLLSRNKVELEAIAHEVYTEYDTDTMIEVADVKKASEVKHAFDNVMNNFGRVDILVTAAGVGHLKPVTELTVEEFDDMIDTNLKGTFYAAKYAAEIMVRQKEGHIITLPGILGKAAMRMSSGYSASKYGVTGLIKGMTQDLMRDNVRLSLLHFGGVNTSFWDKITMRVQRDKMLSAQQAAEVIFFCARQPSGTVLGEVVLQPDSHQL